MESRTDVLVVGGGPVGACCAYELALSGAAVTLLERETDVCPAVSGAHANCGWIAQSHVTPLAYPGALGRGLRWLLDGSSPFYVAPRPSADLARWLWLFRGACTMERARATMPVLRALNAAAATMHDELGSVHGDSWLYHRNGAVQVEETAAGMDGAREEAEIVRVHGGRAEELDAAATRERLPGLLFEPAGSLFFPEDAHLDPLLFTTGVARLAAEAGASIATGTEALALAPDQRGVLVTTTRGELVAGQVVLAAGAWTPGLVRKLGLRLPIEPAKGYSVDVDRPRGIPELPVLLDEAHTVLTPLGNALRVGSTLELSGWDTSVRERRVRGLRLAAERAIGLPADGPYRQLWRGPRPVTPDGLPVIARLPRRDRVIVAAGHCMLGLTLGPVTGRLVAELAGGRATSIDLAPLTATRWD